MDGERERRASMTENVVDLSFSFASPAYPHSSLQNGREMISATRVAKF